VVLATGLPIMVIGLAKMGLAKKEIKLSKNSQAAIIVSLSIQPANYTNGGSALGIYVGINF
jgi:hypothetical protein